MPSLGDARVDRQCQRWAHLHAGLTVFLRLSGDLTYW
jgi:hypothetical protein